MSNHEVLKKINLMPEEQFRDVCWDIAQDLGFSQPKYFEAPNVQVALQETITRKSTDEMFRTHESWLLAFVRTENYLSADTADAILDAATSADVENLFTLVFGMLDQKVKEEYHTLAKSSNIKSVLLSDRLATDLACDYIADMREECSNVARMELAESGKTPGFRFASSGLLA